MNSVDLFSGLGATALALGDTYGSPICNPAVFFDCCAFSRALLKERAEQGYFGPRWNSIRIADDVRSLTRHPGDGDVQILTAGYCCQDLSTVGTRGGLCGTRCGLFFEIPRFADEFNVASAFLENVPDQCSNRLDKVVGALHDRGSDCRWRCLGASELGAPHERNRVFLLAKRRDGTGSGRVKLQSVAEAIQAARRFGSQNSFQTTKQSQRKCFRINH